MNTSSKRATYVRRTHIPSRGPQFAATLALLLVVAAPLAAADLPWVYDTSGRTAEADASFATGTFASTLVSMAGRWWKATTGINLRTDQWIFSLILMQ